MKQAKITLANKQNVDEAQTVSLQRPLSACMEE
jgi:hypothetical protein